MNVLYKSTRGSLPCSIIQKDNIYFCTIGEQQNMIHNSFTEDEKSLDFLFDCIIDAYYSKYLAKKELGRLRLTNYFLMHKNRRVLAFSIENNSVISVKLNEKEKPHLPVSYNGDMMKWLLHRSIPVTRKGLSKTSEKVDTFGLMLRNLGLSLTDAYWINPVGSNYTWDSVNLYSNDFRDSMSLDLTDNCDDIVGKTNFLPSASLQGIWKKSG